jgi:type VI protein secretion system component Hcp
MSSRLRYVLCSVLALASGPALAQVDAFLCIDGMPGESLDATFPECIVPTSSADTAFLEGPLPELRDFRFTKLTDRASIPLRKALVTGEPVKATLHLRRVSGEGTPPTFWSIVLFDARVTSFSAAAPGNEVLEESVSLRPSRVEWMYRRQLLNGSYATPEYACWEVGAGTVADGQCPP